MGRSILLLASLSLLIGCDRADQVPEAGGSTERANIVLIVADDLGYADVGAYGAVSIETPNIDRLAAQGARFTDGYVAAAVCSPSRAGLMTGMFPSRFGYDYNPTANYASGSDAKLGLPVELPTLADMLGEAGYATALVGKWHLGAEPQYHPLQRGFAEFFGFIGGGRGYFDVVPGDAVSWRAPPSGQPSAYPRIMHDGDTPTTFDGYLTDALADRAVAFIEAHKEEPFFLMLSANAPHTPIEATTAYADRYADIEHEGERIFSAMVGALDDAVGEVAAALTRHGLEENTLVVFVSDNGCIDYVGPIPICSNAPLAGAKRYQLEGGVRVPFIMRWPQAIPAGTVFTDPVSTIDFFATFAGAAGSTATTSDSVNLVPFVTGEQEGPPHESLFWRAAPNASIRHGQWKLWRVDRTELDPNELREFGKLLPPVDYPPISPHGQVTLLYDLADDISESNNVAAEHPDVVADLSAKLRDWEAGLAAPLWTSGRSTVAEVDGQRVQLYF